MQDDGMLKALRLFLLDDKKLSKMLSGIFTISSVQAAYPYATLGLESVKLEKRRTKICFHLKIWSTYQGIKQLQSVGIALQQHLGKPGFTLTFGASDQGAIGKVAVFKEIQQNLNAQQQGISCLTYQYEALIRTLVKTGKEGAQKG